MIEKSQVSQLRISWAKGQQRSMGSKTHLSISGFCLVSAPISLLLEDDTLEGMLLKHPISNMDRTVGATGGGNSMVVRLIPFVHGNIFPPAN